MRLHPIISRNFLYLDQRRTIEETRRLLRATKPRYLVVAVDADRYLVATRDFEERVAGAPGSTSLEESRLLEELLPAEVHAPGEGEPDRGPSLVAEYGAVTGVLTWRAGGGRRNTGEPDRGDGGEEVDATRYVRADIPEEVFAGERVLLSVEVGSRESSLPVHLPGGARLDVVVQARQGLVVEGDSAGTLALPAEGATSRVEFWLRAADPGAGDVRVYVYDEGTPLGAVALHPRVLASPAMRAPASPQTPLLTGAAFLDTAPAAAPPDLSLLILEERGEGATVLRMRVTARDTALGLNFREFGPVRMDMDPRAYFHDFFADIKALGRDGPADRTRRKLEARGERLFETLLPADLQALLWDLRTRITSVEIHSSEAWIPWELCRMTGPGEAGGVVAGPFFCEAFEITRWIPGIPRRPRLTLDNLAIVMQNDPELFALPEERRDLLSLAGAGRVVEEVPARYVEVAEALAAGSYDGFHFSGHGSARAPDADRSAIFLDDDELRPEDLSGVMRNLGRANPLVFLNACHGARGGVSLVGAGGWAHRWLQAGAGAFVAAYWTVDDQTACDFSRAFYREIRGGRTVGAAVRAARLAVRTDHDPTWLAYAVFCDTSAVVRG